MNCATPKGMDLSMKAQFVEPKIRWGKKGESFT